MQFAVAFLVCLMVSGCAPWSADPSGSTEVELDSSLSTQQVVAVHNAVLELNAAISREVFTVSGEHFGRLGHVTINATKPPKGYRAYTHLYLHRGEINLGDVSGTNYVVHELIHVILGDDDHHSDDPSDVFNARVTATQVITQGTLQRLDVAMGVDSEGL